VRYHSLSHRLRADGWPLVTVLQTIALRQAKRRCCRAVVERQPAAIADRTRWPAAFTCRRSTHNCSHRGLTPGSDFAAYLSYFGLEFTARLARFAPAWESGVEYFRGPPAQEQTDGICSRLSSTASRLCGFGTDEFVPCLSAPLSRPGWRSQRYFSRPEPPQTDSAWRA
jgi:hypothetical protein